MTETTSFFGLRDKKDALHGLSHLDFGHSILSFDIAQDGELVESFRVSDFVLRIYDIKAETPEVPLRIASTKAMYFGEGLQSLFRLSFRW
jgi:hypothetical protein